VRRRLGERGRAGTVWYYQTQEADEADEADEATSQVAPFGRNGNLALVGHQSPAPNGRNLRGAIGHPSPAPNGRNLRGGRSQPRSARGASERDMQGIADAIFGRSTLCGPTPTPVSKLWRRTSSEPGPSTSD
jgi:hypothetical protein